MGDMLTDRVVSRTMFQEIRAECLIFSRCWLGKEWLSAGQSSIPFEGLNSRAHNVLKLLHNGFHIIIDDSMAVAGTRADFLMSHR